MVKHAMRSVAIRCVAGKVKTRAWQPALVSVKVQNRFGGMRDGV